MVDAGLSVDNADSLLHDLSDASPVKRRRLLQHAMDAASDRISDVVIQTGDLKDLVQLDYDSGAAICTIASQHTDPFVRSTFATMLGKQAWLGSVPMLGYLVTDENEKVKKSALSSLRKLDPLLFRVLTAPVQLPSAVNILVTGLGSPLGSIVYNDTTINYDTSVGAEINTDANDSDGNSGGFTGGGDRASTRGDESTSAPPPELAPAATLRRFTRVDYVSDNDQPERGALAVSLAVEREGNAGATVDVRIRAGKQHVNLIVHVSSETLDVSPEFQRIKLPRNGDSETARFDLETKDEGIGDVLVTIFDETRLIGSLVVKMKTELKDDKLVLRKLETEVFREAGSSADIPVPGLTIQVSLAGGVDGPVRFHALFVNKSGKTEFVPLGTSREAFTANNAGLSKFRQEVKTITDKLSTPANIGAKDRDDAYKALETRFIGVGRSIFNNLLSAGVQAILLNRAPDTVIHWAIKNDALD